MSGHTTTCSDEIVRGLPGTVARCSCGWNDAWGVRDGSAEEAAHHHANPRRAETAIPTPAPSSPKRANQITTAMPETCHACTCHIAPPCSQCENCAHWDNPDCDRDCQTCDQHDEP